ncbi:hypothetical protein M8494_18515 [Serratia ureilytica]
MSVENYQALEDLKLRALQQKSRRLPPRKTPVRR